jgi:hypothetical protein
VTGRLAFSRGPTRGPTGGPPDGPVGGPPGGHPASRRRRGNSALHAAFRRSAFADINVAHQRGRVRPTTPAGSPASIALGASTIATPPARQRSSSERRPRPRGDRRDPRGFVGGPSRSLAALSYMDGRSGWRMDGNTDALHEPVSPASSSPIVAPSSIPASPGFAGAPGGPRLRLGFRDLRRARSCGCGCRGENRPMARHGDVPAHPNPALPVVFMAQHKGASRTPSRPRNVGDPPPPTATGHHLTEGGLQPPCPSRTLGAVARRSPSAADFDRSADSRIPSGDIAPTGKDRRCDP